MTLEEAEKTYYGHYLVMQLIGGAKYGEDRSFLPLFDCTSLETGQSTLDYCEAEGFERVFLYHCVDGEMELDPANAAKLLRILYGS